MARVVRQLGVTLNWLNIFWLLLLTNLGNLPPGKYLKEKNVKSCQYTSKVLGVNFVTYL